MFRLVIAVAFMLLCDGVSARSRAQLDTPVKRPCPDECKDKPMELSFVVDASASIWPQNFTLGLNFIEDFVGIFKISDKAVRVSVITYGDVVYVQDAINFDTFGDKAALQFAISKLTYHSGSRTNTSGGIWHMLRQQMPQAREGVRRVAIVLTDGNSQEADLTQQAALDAHQAGLEVFAIGVGHDVSLKELYAIASEERNVLHVDNYHMLQSIKKRLHYQTCGVPPVPPCRMDPVDLAFVIDSSQSIGDDDFNTGMEFVRNFVSSFDISPSAVRVAVITFGERFYAEDAFGFRQYTDKMQLLNRLGSIQWRHGSATNTSEGIKFMTSQLMPEARPHAAHVAIVITDGRSQQPEKTKEAAKAARAQRIVMYAVGVGQVGQELDMGELTNIAGDSSRVLLADTYTQLNLIKEKLTRITCDGILQALRSLSNEIRTS